MHNPACHILAVARHVDEWTRVLKHGDTFAVLDHFGDVKPGGLGEEGLYHDGTRFLSCLVLELEGSRPLFLSSTVREGNDELAVALTNPDLLANGQVRLPLGSLYLAWRKFLWQGVCHQQLLVKNYATQPVVTSVSLHFAADFADIYEVRGMQRPAHGQPLSAEVGDESVALGYRGLDEVVRRTLLRFQPRPAVLTASTARFDLALRPGEETACYLDVACRRNGMAAPPAFTAARDEAQTQRKKYTAWSCHLQTSNGLVNAWIDRAAADLHMMTTELPTGPYPYAGVPWFNTPFGRDGIITALECLWLRPDLARGVLAYLASTQATQVIPEEDAQPGKILHETRKGEMAALREMPFGRYYGSVDATPLFVVLAGAYFQRSGDRAFVESLWPHVEAALQWIDLYGDPDGDGFVEYQRQTAAGLLHQGWKDSDDAIFHADGSPAEDPIALCEVQGYVYAARRAGAALAAELGRVQRSAELTRQARDLRERFERAFWCQDLGTYALALDGQKRVCRVRASNAGHCLFAGIAGESRAKRVAATLLSPQSFSGWGVRTVAAGESRYNPMSYHAGSVWPHDNALIAQGLSRYGLTERALSLWNGLFAAAMHFESHRMPELFCGFPQEAGEGPVLYPVACAPQAWAAASVFLLLQACLGMDIDAPRGQITLLRPQLPATLAELRIHNLKLGAATVDLLLRRHAEDVGVNVLRREGNVEIVVVK